MDPTRPDRILEEWSAVADGARRPSMPPRRVVVRGGSAGLSLAGASVIAVVLLATAIWLGRPGSTGPGGVVPTASPSATIQTLAPSASPAPTPPATRAPTVTAAPTPTSTPTIVACAPAALAARITLWEGAAGSRIAHVQVTNTGRDACTLERLERPQLIDGAGRVLIDGTGPSSRAVIDLAPGEKVTTLVETSNYCGAAPVPPVRIAFVLRDGNRFIAAPPSPADATVPPCNGPGQPAVIGMQPWAR